MNSTTALNRQVSRHSYHVEGLTDLGTFQAEAELRLQRTGDPTVIHCHSFDECCDRGPDSKQTHFVKEKP